MSKKTIFLALSLCLLVLCALIFTGIAFRSLTQIGLRLFYPHIIQYSSIKSTGPATLHFKNLEVSHPALAIKVEELSLKIGVSLKPPVFKITLKPRNIMIRSEIVIPSNIKLIAFKFKTSTNKGEKQNYSIIEFSQGTLIALLSLRKTKLQLVDWLSDEFKFQGTVDLNKNNVPESFDFTGKTKFGKISKWLPEGFLKSDNPDHLYPVRISYRDHRLEFFVNNKIFLRSTWKFK